MDVVSSSPDAYPVRTVRLLVPFPPGGSTEFTASSLAEPLREILGQPFIVEARVGDFGLAALRELLHADPYTLMVGSVNTNSIAPVVFRRSMNFDYDTAIVPVSRLAEFPSVLLTGPSVRATTLPELIDEARTARGKVRNGTDWIGSYPDIDAVRLAKAAGFEVVNVPRAGGADGLLAALVEGKLDMLFLNARTASMAVHAGHVKPVAVTGPIRLAGFPHVPTLEESGFRGIGTRHWHGLFASSRTPVEIVRRLHHAVTHSLNRDEVRALFERAGGRVALSASPRQFAEELRQERAQWERIAADVNPCS
jgi:tripartite-type tricarboxylate transporter receptor subunit TctC